MTQAARGALRIGCVKYLNARPLIHGWSGPVDFDHPAALCRKLAEGELDVALVSSFEFLRNPVYTIVDDVALAADGAVYSVIVAHRGRIEEVEEIVLDPASLTSVNLLDCLLRELRLKPRLVSVSPNERNDISAKSARLLIGDQAIRFRPQHEGDCHFMDLGAEWKRTTGLPFVFALWLIRPELENPAAIADQLRARRDANLASLEQVIAAETAFPPEFCLRYYREFLRFGMGEREKEGLTTFRSLCEKHGILPPNATPLRLA